jgi:hypothetical protein
MNEQLHRNIRERLESGKLPCSQAHAAAQELGLDPLAVGKAADEAGIRVSRCQLGLFGYGPKAEGKHKIVQAMGTVPEPLAERLQQQTESDGITCLSIWQVADELGYQRIEASSAVEALGLRVSRCQLGCFPRS